MFGWNKEKKPNGKGHKRGEIVKVGSRTYVRNSTNHDGPIVIVVYRDDNGESRSGRLSKEEYENGKHLGYASIWGGFDFEWIMNRAEEKLAYG